MGRAALGYVDEARAEVQRDLDARFLACVVVELAFREVDFLAPFRPHIDFVGHAAALRLHACAHLESLGLEHPADEPLERKSRRAQIKERTLQPVPRSRAFCLLV